MKDSSPRRETGGLRELPCSGRAKRQKRWKFIQLLGIILLICVSLFPFECYNRGNRSSHDAEDRKASGELHKRMRCSPQGKGGIFVRIYRSIAPGAKGRRSSHYL